MVVARLANEDRQWLLVAAPSKFCPRKLGAVSMGPTVKRYMGVGKPLLGYMIACPGCGFTEMHMHAKAGFVESDTGDLIATLQPVQCINCKRQIRVFTEGTMTFVDAKLVCPTLR